MITLSNNKQNKYSNSVYKIYLKPCHDHCFLPTYFQNNKKTHNDLARRLFTLKRFQYCRFLNTFQLAFFPSLLSTCRSRLLFASLRERRKFGVDQRVTINMEVNLHTYIHIYILYLNTEGTISIKILINYLQTKKQVKIIR